MLKCIKARFIIFFIFSLNILSDSFKYSNFNNFGSLGLINTPTARFLDSPSGSFTAFRGDPDRKVTLTMFPYDWMEASIFYSDITNQPYGDFPQSLKDKGFNVKFRLKEEGNFPAIAVGLIDFAGTGYYSSEYLVASYGINNLDISLGIGWGNLNGDMSYKNPFIALDKNFENRPTYLEDRGGQIQTDRYFSGKTVSIFGGLNYVFNDKVNLVAEYDPTVTPGKVGFEESNSKINIGLNYKFNSNVTAGLSYERGNYFGLKVNYKDNFFKQEKNFYKPKKVSNKNYYDLINTIQKNNIGVAEVSELDNKVSVEISQYSLSNKKKIDSILSKSLKYSDMDEEEVLFSYGIAGLKVIKNEIQKNPSRKIQYKRSASAFRQNFGLKIRPFIAGREDFLKLGIFFEHDTEIIFSENLFFSSNLKLSLIDNFNDLIYPPVTTFPAQVRSDIKKYLNNIGNKISIGRAQVEYFKTFKENHHILLSGGIYEDMFSGYGLEYLNFIPDKNYAWGFEIHEAFKRDYDFGFGLLDYQNTTYFFNFYFNNKFVIPFDMKLSYGEYLAGDEGATFEFSRSFDNGVEIGFFTSFTDVSSEDFGEGSFDKGIFFKIPFGQKRSFNNFLWRPLTKDPASKLIRKNDIYNLVKRFR